jgi:hypothetical protein
MPGQTHGKLGHISDIHESCLYVEWDFGRKIFPLIKIAQIGFQVLSRDLVEESFGWMAGTINSGA